MCMALIPVLNASANRFGILDTPGDRKIHEKPIGRLGGVAFAVSAFAAIAIWAPHDKIIIPSLLGGSVILAFGIWDDAAALNYRVKFLGQILAAFVFVWFAEVSITALPFLEDVPLPTWCSMALTILLLVGITNAINLAYGLDGLAGGLSLISFACIAYLAYLASDLPVVLMMVPVLGGLLGFLRFNTYPARVFMGDGGSQFLGFFLGVAALALVDDSRSPYSLALVPLLLGLPMLDTLCVMGQRVLEGRSPFLPDNNHIHHKLAMLAPGLAK